MDEKTIATIEKCVSEGFFDLIEIFQEQKMNYGATAYPEDIFCFNPLQKSVRDLKKSFEGLLPFDEINDIKEFMGDNISDYKNKEMHCFKGISTKIHLDFFTNKKKKIIDAEDYMKSGIEKSKLQIEWEFEGKGLTTKIVEYDSNEKDTCNALIYSLNLNQAIKLPVLNPVDSKYIQKICQKHFKNFIPDPRFRVSGIQEDWRGKGILKLTSGNFQLSILGTEEYSKKFIDGLFQVISKVAKEIDYNFELVEMSKTGTISFNFVDKNH